jgi:hypothetical protein
MRQRSAADEAAIAFSEVEVVREGTLSLVCRVKGKEALIPRPQALRRPPPGERGPLVIPRWLAREKGLI